jgi:3'-phosphoadenosine 5'-phosphosulfate sulfotransferase (PAPS reductase)/FAD synthetase
MKTALQFSGGKDAMVLVHMLREYLDHITVYCLRQKFIFDETQKAIDWAKTLAPHFVEVYSERPKGTLPSDLVPVRDTGLGKTMEAKEGLEILDRYVCCWTTIMQPLEARMHEDGITRVLRGQKTADRYKSPTRSGTIERGIEYIFPLEKWTDEEIFAYFKTNDLPLPANYSKLRGGLDCIGCTAWLEEGKLAYLKEAHPKIAKDTLRNIRVIAEIIKPHMELLEETCNA